MSEAARDLAESPEGACPGAPWLPANGCLDMAPSLCYQAPFGQGYAQHDLDALADAMEAHDPLSSDPYAEALRDSGRLVESYRDPQQRDNALRLPPVSTIIQASLAKDSYEPVLADGGRSSSRRLLDGEPAHFLTGSQAAPNALLQETLRNRPGELLDSAGLTLPAGPPDVSEGDRSKGPGSSSGAPGDETSSRAMLSLAEQWVREVPSGTRGSRDRSDSSSPAGDSSPLGQRDGLLSEESLSPRSSSEAPPALLPVIPSLFSLSSGLQPLPPLLLSGMLPSSLRPDEGPAVRVKQEPPEEPAKMRQVPLPSGDPAKPFQCSLCGKHLASKNVHQLHMRSHSGEKPFTCALCGHRFSQKTSLTRHMRSHTGERPFPCEVCGKRFADKERIKIHMRTHTGEKPFACEVCGKTFSQKSTVKRHMSVHTGEKPFKCPVCGKGFANRGNLNAHAKTHAHS